MTQIVKSHKPQRLFEPVGENSRVFLYPNQRVDFFTNSLSSRVPKFDGNRFKIVREQTSNENEEYCEVLRISVKSFFDVEKNDSIFYVGKIHFEGESSLIVYLLPEKGSAGDGLVTVLKHNWCEVYIKPYQTLQVILPIHQNEELTWYWKPNAKLSISLNEIYHASQTGAECLEDDSLINTCGFYSGEDVVHCFKYRLGHGLLRAISSPNANTGYNSFLGDLRFTATNIYGESSVAVVQLFSDLISKWSNRILGFSEKPKFNENLPSQPAKKISINHTKQSKSPKPAKPINPQIITPSVVKAKPFHTQATTRRCYKIDCELLPSFPDGPKLHAQEFDPHVD